MMMYTDDEAGDTPQEHLYADVATLNRVLIGEECITDDKTVTGTRIDFVGYVVDLTMRRIGVSTKNILRPIYRFFPSTWRSQ